MPDSAGYLPPVVARIVGDIHDLVTKLQEAKALLREFAGERGDVRLGADSRKLAADLAKARMEVTQLTEHTYQIQVGADISRGLAEVQALKDAASAGSSDVRVGARPTAGSLAAGALGSLFGTGGRSVLGGAMWGNTGGGFMSRLLSPLTMFSQMFSAGFGSVGSFAGFSPEHLAMTAGGLMGLGVEGGAGAGLLGLGSAGVSGVGALTDQAGMKQALGDIRNVTRAQNNLSQAVALYGAHSAQAARAQRMVNFQLSQFSPVARTAVAAAAQTAHGFRVMYDKVTGEAEKIGAQILQQGMKTGEAFLPTLGKAAAKNMGIIQKGLQPLFKWMTRGGNNGGLGIFQNLEKVFSSHLPTDVKLFDNGLELLLRTINLIAPQTGKFVSWLEKITANANGKGWSTYAGHVEHLIGDFRLLEKFFKALGHDLKGVFKDSAGEPQAIIKMWTTGLQRLGKWIDSINGKKKIQNLFAVHKAEIMNILHIIGKLSTSFGKVYLTVAPAFVTAVNRMLSAVNPFLQAVVKNPFGAWVVGIAVIGARFGLFKGILSQLGQGVKGLIGALAKSVMGMFGMAAATTAEGTASTAAAAAADLLKGALMIGILGAIIALAFGIYELVKHWKTVWGAIKRITMDVVHAVVGFFTRLWHDITSIIGKVIGWVKAHWKLLAEILIAIFLPGGIVIAAVIRFWPQIKRFFTRGIHDVVALVERLWHDVTSFFSRMWHDVTNFVSRIWHDVVNFFKRMWHDVTNFVSRLWHDVVNFFKRIWHDIITGVEAGVKDVISWFKSLPQKIISALGNLGSMLVDAGKAIIGGLWSGLKSAWHGVTGWLSGRGHEIKNKKGPPAVDAALLVDNGRLIMHGLGVGLRGGWAAHVAPLMASMTDQLRSGIGGGGTIALSGGLSVRTVPNPQLTRIEKLLTNILGEAKTTTANTKATVGNTKVTADRVNGLSSPAGVAAQIAQSHSRLVTSLRAGVAR